MRLQQYILHEGRSKNLSKESYNKLLNKHCKIALSSYEKDNVIYRGIVNSIDYGVVNPKSDKPRKSANTSNLYTFIVDNSKRWKGYPKRSQSIICTTDKEYASDYGTPHLILPYDNAHIGLCPDSDFWVSFEKTLDKYVKNATMLDELNDIAIAIFDHFDVIYDETTYKSFRQSFNNLQKVIDYKIIQKQFPLYKEGDSFYDYLDEILDPKKNGFKLVKIGDNLPVLREVWTDSKSLVRRL